MSRQRADPFGGSTPKKEIPPKGTGLRIPKKEIPPKGTGLSTGTAGERRAGNPRTDTERTKRHGEVMDDSSANGEFVTIREDGGRIRFTRKGYENVPIPPVTPKSVMPKPEPKSLSLREEWAKYREKG